MAELAVIAGSLAQKPGAGGHTWQFLQYLLGFRRLGWDVLFLDRLEPDMCRAGDIDGSENLAYLARIMDGFGLASHYAVALNGGTRFCGLDRRAVVERVRNATVFINVMGFFTDEEILAAAPCKVLLDTDPGFGQMWQDLGQAMLFRGHDAYVTIAENIGAPECTIPTCGIDWVVTRQPVVLEQWHTTKHADAGAFTGIGAWRGPYAPVEYRGHTYGLRVHEFRKFFALPRHTGLPFQLALDIDDADARDRQQLIDNGWQLLDAAAVTGDPWRYRALIHASRAEILVAKGIYVDTNSGWFSERSMCFLASGRPVLAQDTGLSALYPTDRGLLVFRTPEDAVAGAAEIARDWRGHAAAAREIAAEYFDSDKVLPRLVERVTRPRLQNRQPSMAALELPIP